MEHDFYVGRISLKFAIGFVINNLGFVSNLVARHGPRHRADLPGEDPGPGRRRADEQGARRRRGGIFFLKI